MFWLGIRTILYISIFTLIWYGGNFYVSQELVKGLHKTSPHAVFVDQSILKNETKSKLQNGSLSYPFSTITPALTFAKENNISTIIIDDGVYNETLIVPENITLFGKNNVIIASSNVDGGDILKPQNNTKIINITLDGGKNGINLKMNKALRLYNTTIKNSRNFGIKMEAQHEKRNQYNQLIPTYDFLYKTQQEIEKKPLIRISNSTITNNESQGLYLASARVEIEDTVVTKNGEEGIDLHPHMHVTIKNVLSKDNGEGGLESEIYDNIVTITDSTFDNNIKSGVAFITHIGTGQIILKNNTIVNNQKYGMRCALHKKKPPKPRPFFQTTIQRENNIFNNNALGDISYEFCYTF